MQKFFSSTYLLSFELKKNGRVNLKTGKQSTNLREPDVTVLVIQNNFQQSNPANNVQVSENLPLR